MAIENIKIEEAIERVRKLLSKEKEISPALNFFFSENRPLLSKIRSLIPLKRILKYYLLNIYDGVYFELKALK